MPSECTMPDAPMTRRKSLLIQLFLFMLASLCLISAYQFLINWDALLTTEIQVKGNQRLTRTEVIRQAGIAPGVNYISINPERIQQNLLRHSWIAAARVARELPAKLHIEVREHVPLAVLDLRERYILNTAGELFKKWEETDPLHLPEIRGLRYGDLRDDAARTFGNPFKSVMNVLQSGNTSEGLLSNRWIEKIEVDREIGLTLWLRSAPYLLDVRKIHLGYQLLSHQAERMNQLVHYLRTVEQIDRIASVDLSDPDAIIVVPAHRPAVSGSSKEEA